MVSSSSNVFQVFTVDHFFRSQLVSVVSWGNFWLYQQSLPIAGALLRRPPEFSHLRECRKRWLWQLSLLESLTRSRNALLLWPGDVKKNPGPAAATTADSQSKKNKLLIVIHVNACSLLRHFNDPTSLVSSVRPHIIAISETWLDSSVSDNEIYLAGYNLFRLIIIVLVVVLLCVVVIIFLASCFIVILPLESNPCGFLWELAASTFFLPLVASTVHLLLHPRMETLLNYACCTVLRKHKGSSTLAARRELGLSTLASRRKLHLAVTMFNCMSSKSPPYLSQLFSLPSSHYNTRSASSSQLNLPPNRSSIGQKSFSFMGAALWQSLPQNIQDTRDFARFYSLSQQHFYQWFLTFIACTCMIFLWLIPHYS